MDRGTEATPLVVDGVMYTTGAYSIIYALNPKSGALIWKYDPQVPRAKAGKVYVGTIDGRLIAINAKDGSL